MPTLNRASNERELQRLISIFLKAETDIINEIGRLRSQGLVDYHAVASLERIQNILRKLENDSWEYVPKMIERQFYVRLPEARKITEPVAKHITGIWERCGTDWGTACHCGYSGDESDGRNHRRLYDGYGNIAERTSWPHRAGCIPRVGLEQVAAMQAREKASIQPSGFVEALRREGVTAFVDKAGRNWSLHTYGSMVLRTTSRQAEGLAVLTADPEHDLYKISSHGTTCPLCAPYEGRVYSKSGQSPDFPPLSTAFGKVDPNGPDTLANTWLNIHPNCLHVLLPWTPAGRTPEEIQKIKDFSNPSKNPFSRDPRTQKQIEAYRQKEMARRNWLANYRQWERYRMTLGNKVPRTFETFQRHKAADDEKYKDWERLYREANHAY